MTSGLSAASSVCPSRCRPMPPAQSSSPSRTAAKVTPYATPPSARRRARTCSERHRRLRLDRRAARAPGAGTGAPAVRVSASWGTRSGTGSAESSMGRGPPSGSPAIAGASVRSGARTTSSESSSAASGRAGSAGGRACAASSESGSPGPGEPIVLVRTSSPIRARVLNWIRPSIRLKELPKFVSIANE